MKMSESQTSKGNFYITTTLPYVNAEPHLGHAMEFIRADVVARYKKLQGFDVFFNTGTDEHGMKLFEGAKKEGKTEQEYVDFYAGKVKDLLKLLGISDDVYFIRTTDEKHVEAAKAFWNKVLENGYIYKKNYKAKYCVGCEEEKTDSDLVDDKCPIHPNRELEIIEEENYFFKYSAFQEKLTKFYDNNPTFVIPDFRLNEMKGFVKGGLQDFSISRLKSKMPWGIEVPGDSDHIMYVWFDALVNYIATLGYPNLDGDFKKYWLEGETVQYCGKDNNRFQSSMWQAMLMAAELPNTKHVIINGFITGEGGVKMSKSLGNVANPKDLISEYGTDALRYFLLREVGAFEDSPYAEERFKAAYNSGLANGLGNLVSRVMRMATTNGVVLDANIVEDIKQTEVLKAFYEKSNKGFEGFNLQIAIDAVWDLISFADKYIQDNQPFKTIKIDKEKGERELGELLAYLDIIAENLLPILPETASKISQYVKTGTMPEAPLFLRKD